MPSEATLMPRLAARAVSISSVSALPSGRVVSLMAAEAIVVPLSVISVSVSAAATIAPPAK